MSFGNVVVASAEVQLCDWESHTVNVTVAGNGTTLEVDGQPGLTESVEDLEALDLSSSYSTFIGGIPGEGIERNLWVSDLSYCDTNVPSTHAVSLLQMFLWCLRQCLLSTPAAWVSRSTAVCWTWMRPNTSTMMSALTPALWWALTSEAQQVNWTN